MLQARIGAAARGLSATPRLHAPMHHPEYVPYLFHDKTLSVLPHRALRHQRASPVWVRHGKQQAHTRTTEGCGTGDWPHLNGQTCTLAENTPAGSPRPHHAAAIHGCEQRRTQLTTTPEALATPSAPRQRGKGGASDARCPESDTRATHVLGPPHASASATYPVHGQSYNRRT